MPAKKRPLEIRQNAELRSTGEAGEFEGYIAVWDTTDSYESQFQRGAFKKTIQERGNRIKVLYNHDKLIGSALELREDDHGCFVRGRINLDTQLGKETHALMRAGDLDGLSFAFQCFKDEMRNKVRVIQEVRLFEFGPVDFPANEAAKVVQTRSESILALLDEERSTDFTETLMDSDLRIKGRKILEAQEETVYEIWWSEEYTTPDERVAALDKALADAHAAYVEWARGYMDRFWQGSRAAPVANALAAAFAEYRAEQRNADIAARTALTIDEVNALSRGQLIEARDKLRELPDPIKSAHSELRTAALEALLAQLRGGLTTAEKRRIHALLGPAVPEQQAESEQAAIDELRAGLRSFRTYLEH